MTSELLPDNDPDLRLARQIRSYLEGAVSSIEENNDPVAEVLMAYKQHVETSLLTHSTPTELLWDHIDQKTRPAIRSETQIFSFNITKSRAVWAAAACIVIAALAGVFYLTLSPSPTLLAEANTVIKTITLSDGSEVTLRPHSKLYMLKSSEDAANYRLSGEGFFQVAHSSDRTFNIEAGSGKVSVLGTRFNLSSWGNITQVYLEEGSIQFAHLNNRKSVVLKPGQSLAIIHGEPISDVAAANVDEFTDWMQAQLVFNDKPASYVFKELEHHFNIEISAPDHILTTSISSGGLTLEHEEASLEYLGLVLGGNFRSTGSKTYTFVANK